MRPRLLILSPRRNRDLTKFSKDWYETGTFGPRPRPRLVQDRNLDIFRDHTYVKTTPRQWQLNHFDRSAVQETLKIIRNIVLVGLYAYIQQYAMYKHEVKELKCCSRWRSCVKLAVVHILQFLPRCMECRLGLRWESCLCVCPSVCLSNACIVTKRKKDLTRFLYHTKGRLA